MPRPLLAYACLLLIAASCVPPPAVSAPPRHFSPDTAMGEIQAAGAIKIGVPDDRPVFANVSGAAPEGFLIDLGNYVAAQFHVQADFVPAPNDQLLDMVKAKTVAVAFPLTAATEALVRKTKAYAFSEPYFVAHQRLLVTKGAARNLSDLGNRTVCSAIDPTTEVDPHSISPTVPVLNATSPVQCANAYVRGRVAAVIGSDAVLIGVEKLIHAAQAHSLMSPLAIVGDELTTEGYAAVTEARPGMGPVVSNILERAQSDGTWTHSFERWIKPLEPDADATPPTMTIEEGAALYPVNAPQPSASP